MPSTPHMDIIWSVLESAKDSGDAMMTGACRRLIEANRLGWRKHHHPADWQLVQDFYA